MTMSSTGLVPPVGGALVDLIVPAEAQAELRARANRLPSLQLSERSVYDLELLATGGFSPSTAS
jgi:sulfate adenylyltransferase